MLTYQVAYALALSHIIGLIRLEHGEPNTLPWWHIHQCATLMVEELDKYWRLAERYSGR